MQVAQKLGSFFYTYTQCTKFSFNFLFQGNLGNIREIFVFPCLHEGERQEERASPFQISLYRLRSRAAPTRRAHRGVQTPPLCEYRLVNSSVARQRVSLSSGIRMFARGSETRGVSLKSVIFCRARSRIPNHK